MSNRFGRGFDFRGGKGFGFRGDSSPWPYVGRGRGGLPRCGYSTSGAEAVSATMPFAHRMPPEQGIDFLKNQAQVMRSQLEQIEARIQELGKDKH